MKPTKQEKKTSDDVYRTMKLTRSSAANFYYQNGDLHISFFKPDKEPVVLSGFAAEKALANLPTK